MKSSDEDFLCVWLGLTDAGEMILPTAVLADFLWPKVSAGKVLLDSFGEMTIAVGELLRVETTVSS